MLKRVKLHILLLAVHGHRREVFMNLQEERELFIFESEIYERMRVVARTLNTRVIEPIVRFRLVDKKTGKIKLFREKHSHSFVRNMYVSTTSAVPYQTEGTLYEDGHLRLWETNNTLNAGAIFQVNGSGSPENLGSGFYAAASADDHGVVAGRDATAESFDDYELGNLITDGSGPNQFEYIETVKAEAWNGGSSYYSSTWTRAMDNASGAGITVYEIGLVYKKESTSIFLISRDIDAGGVLVPNGDRLYVEYEIRTSFP